MTLDSLELSLLKLFAFVFRQKQDLKYNGVQCTLELRQDVNYYFFYWKQLLFLQKQVLICNRNGEHVSYSFRSLLSYVGSIQIVFSKFLANALSQSLNRMRKHQGVRWSVFLNKGRYQLKQIRVMYLR